VSIGWRDSSGKSQNGIALLRATAATYVADKVFILPMSVRDLAPGPGNTIVACVFNARAFRSTHRSPTLDVLDTDGNLVAEAFFQQPVGLEDAAARNNSDARVIALPGDRLAFVSPGLPNALFVRLEPSSDAPEGGALQPSRMGSLRTTVESVVNLAPPAAGLLPKMGMPWMRAIYVDERQRIGALYSTGTTKRPTVVLMLNTATGASETAVPVPADLRAAYWAEGQLHAITIDGEHAVVTAVSPPADFP